MHKKISVLVAGSGEIKDLEIMPGTKTGQVLDTAGLQGYQLSRKGGDVLAQDSDIYNLVNDKEKLYATPEDVSVGSSTASPSGVLSSPTARLIQTRGHSCRSSFKTVRVIGIREFKPIRVTGRDKTIPYWQESNWVKTFKGLRGTYKTKFGSWRGLIERNFEGNYSFYIFDPPQQLRDSEHWQCFTYKGEGKYLIHFSEKPESIDSGILSIEGLIAETSTNHKGEFQWRPSFLEQFLENLRLRR